ncbi:MAG: dihydrodipicolinate synthase family protein [Niabella sp.]
MEPLTRTTCKGNWATLLLPVNGDDSIDYARLKEEIDLMVLSGVDGIYSNGTAGEFHMQTENEFYKISSCLAAKLLPGYFFEKIG